MKFGCQAFRSLLLVGLAVVLFRTLPGCSARAVPPDQHRDTVSGLAFSPDSQTLVSGSWDRTIKLRDPNTGRCFRTIDTQHGWIAQLQFSPDGKLLAEANFDGNVYLWEPRTWKQIAALEGHTREVLGVAFSPDGKTLASCGRDHNVLLCDVQTRKIHHTLRAHERWVESVTFFPDGKTVLSGDWDGKIIVWDVGSGDKIKAIDAHRDAVLSLAVSPDGATVATAAQDHTPIKLWDCQSWREELNLHPGGFATSVVFLPNGCLISGCRDGSIDLWNPPNEDVGERSAPLAEWRSTRGQFRSISRLALSPDMGTLASGNDDGIVELWALEPALAAADPNAAKTANPDALETDDVK